MRVWEPQAEDLTFDPWREQDYKEIPEWIEFWKNN
jgi:hypothetical protein